MRMLTFDADWCENWMLEDIVDLLVRNRVKATFFITNELPVLELIRRNADLFELGIHPNFMQGSTHGRTDEEVLRHCKKIVPEAVSMRTHGLCLSSNAIIKACSFGIENDVSIFAPGYQSLKSFAFCFEGCKMRRMPYNWEDDYMMDGKAFAWTSIPECAGDMIFDFHPVHIALNSSGPSQYRAVKSSAVRLTRDNIVQYRNCEEGDGDFFVRLVQAMRRDGDCGMTVSERIAEEAQ